MTVIKNFVVPPLATRLAMIRLGVTNELTAASHDAISFNKFVSITMTLADVMATLVSPMVCPLALAVLAPHINLHSLH